MQHIVLCALVLPVAACASDAVECGTWKLQGTVVDRNNKPANTASVASVGSCTLPSQTLAGKKSYYTTKKDGAFAIEARVCRAGGLDDEEEVRYVACLSDSTCQCHSIKIDEETPGVSLGKVKPVGASGSPTVIAHGYDRQATSLYVMFSTAVESLSLLSHSSLALTDSSGNCDKLDLSYYMILAVFDGNLLELDLPQESCLSLSCYNKCTNDARKCLYDLEYWEDYSKCDYNCGSRCTYTYSAYELELSKGWTDSNLNAGGAAVLRGTLLPQE